MASSSALTAWNYPAALMYRKMGPALIAGNTIVVKSHEGTPLSALEIAQLSTQLDFPPGVINVVSGTGEGLGAALVTPSDPAAHHADRQRARRQGDLPQRRRRPEAPAPGARRQGALHRRRGCRYRRRGEGGGAVALRELRPDLHLQRAHVCARADRRRVHREIRARGEGAEGRRPADHGRCRPEIQRRGTRQGRAHGGGGDQGRRRGADRRPAPDRGRVRARPLVRADGADRDRQPHGDHAGRGLRPGRAGDDRRPTSTRGCGSPTNRATACRPMSSPRTCAA